jgi:hypothetical protein
MSFIYQKGALKLSKIVFNGSAENGTGGVVEAYLTTMLFEYSVAQIMPSDFSYVDTRRS